MMQAGIGAQALTKPIPQSSPVVAAPIVEAQPAYSQPTPSPVYRMPKISTGEAPDIPRQFTLTASGDKTLREIISVYSEATGIDVNHSEFLRVVMIAIRHSMKELTREAASIGRLKRPKNDKGKEGERELMERKIAKAFVSGMRAASVLE